MDTAQQIVTQMAQGDFAAVEQCLADHLKPSLTAGALQATWQGIEHQVGAFQEQGKTSVTVAGHVVEEVVKEIAGWIKQPARRSST